MVCIEKRPRISYDRSSALYFSYLTCLLDRNQITPSLSGSNLLNHFENVTNVHTAESVVRDIIHIHH